MSRMLHAVALLGAVGLLAGCGHTKEARFYSLRGPVGQLAPPVAPRPDARVVALAPVVIPDYLRRPQMVRRAGPHEVEYLEYDRWAGPLAQEAGAALEEALAAELGPGFSVVRAGAGSPGTAVRVEVEIVQFELDSAGFSELKARWSRSDASGPPHVVEVRSPGAFGEAHRRNLDRLAARIADDLRPAPTPGVGP